MKTKMKTRKMALKRFKITKTGKAMHRHQGGRHLKAGKSKRQRAKFKKTVVISESFKKTINSFLPYK